MYTYMYITQNKIKTNKIIKTTGKNSHGIQISVDE